jgi:TonB family protein
VPAGVLAAIAAGLLGCTSVHSGLEPDATPPERPALDATVHVYEESEVDVIARPLAPIQPRYPKELLNRRVEGAVVARIVVWADGTVGPGELVSSSDEAFTTSAREALRRARFEPGRLDDRPVASRVTVKLSFRVEH